MANDLDRVAQVFNDNNQRLMEMYQSVQDKAVADSRQARAENQANSILQSGLREVAQATEEAFTYMGEWQKMVNKQEEQSAAGKPISGDIPQMIFEDNQTQYDHLGDYLHTIETPTLDEAAQEAQNAVERANSAVQTTTTGRS